MRVFVASVIGLILAVPAWAQQPQQQHAWVSVESASQALGAGEPYFTVVPLSDGRVLASGGEDSSGNVVATAAVFDGIRGWTATGSMQRPRWSHAMATLQNGKVMAVGGVTSFTDYYNSYYTCAGISNSVELYDPATGLWTMGTSAPTGRIYAMAVTLRNGKVLVVGGYAEGPPLYPGGTYGCGVVTANTSDLYDPASDSWTSQSMNAAHTTASYDHLYVLGDGRVVVLGDSNPEIFDPATSTWTTFAVPHNETVGTVLADGRLFVVGGYDTAPVVVGNATEQEFTNYAATAAIFDPHTSTWTDTRPIPRLYSNGGAIVQPDGTVLVGGGSFFDWVYYTDCTCYYIGNYTSDGSTYTYDPVTDTWSNGPVSQILNAAEAPQNSVTATGIFSWTNSTLIPTVGGRLLFIDQIGSFSGLTAVFRVVTPPTAVASNQTFAGLNGVVGQYTLNASGSSDADGDQLVQYSWSENGTVLTTSTTPTAAVLLSGGQTHILTLTVTDATTQTGSTQVTVAISDPTQQIQTALDTALANEKSLQAQLDAANTALNTANAAITALKAQIAAINAQLTSMQALLASAFSDPSFTLPGTTVQAQIQNLVTAIQQLNHGQQQAIYKNLGGTKGVKGTTPPLDQNRTRRRK